MNLPNEHYYDLLNPLEFATGSDVNKCQIAIGKSGTTYLQTKSTDLAVPAALPYPAGCNAP